jgi:hypothetical protein
LWDGIVSKPNSKDALSAAVKYLKADRWLKDRQGSVEARRGILMRQAGVEHVEGNKGFPVEKLTGKNADCVIALALDGDLLAHQALCIGAGRLTADKATLPLALQRYVVSAAARLNIGKKGHRAALFNDLRDDAILDAVEIVMKFGFGATRNAGHKVGHESACSIVARALGECGAALSESRVSDIWKKRVEAWKQAGIAR